MDTIENIIFSCCILYNKIVDNKRDVPGLENILALYIGNNAPMYCGIFFKDFATRLNAWFHYGEYRRWEDMKTKSNKTT